MTTIKEYREFFLRATAVNIGDKKDQEIGYATTTTIEDCCGKVYTVSNRLLREHCATDETVQKFLESIAFKLNLEDTAQATQQGLVKRASDGDSTEYTYYDPTTVMSKAVMPHQMPDVVASAGITVTKVYYDVTLDDGTTYANKTLADASGNAYRAQFQVATSSALAGASQLLYNSVSDSPTTSTGVDESLKSYTLNTTDYFNSSGDKLEMKGQFTISGAYSTAKYIRIKVGSTILADVNVLNGEYEVSVEFTKTGGTTHAYKQISVQTDIYPTAGTREPIAIFTATLGPSITLAAFGNNPVAGNVVCNSFEVFHKSKV